MIYLLLHRDSPGNDFAGHLLSMGINLVTWQSSGDKAHTHASVLVDAKERKIIEAFYPVVRTRTLDVEEIPYIDILEVPGVDESAAVAFLEAQIGKPYSVVDLFHFVTRQTDTQAEGASFFCSRLAFCSFSIGGVNLFSRCESFKVCPGLLWISPKANSLGTLADFYKQMALGKVS